MKIVRIEFCGYMDIEAENVRDAKEKVKEMIDNEELTIEDVIIEYEEFDED